MGKHKVNCMFHKKNVSVCLVCYVTKKGVCYEDFDVYKSINDWYVH
jgi:hypothetical protein